MRNVITSKSYPSWCFKGLLPESFILSLQLRMHAPAGHVEVPSCILNIPFCRCYQTQYTVVFLYNFCKHDVWLRLEKKKTHRQTPIHCPAPLDKQNSQTKENRTAPQVHRPKLLLSTDITLWEEKTSSLNCFSRNLPFPIMTVFDSTSAPLCLFRCFFLLPFLLAHPFWEPLFVLINARKIKRAIYVTHRRPCAAQH